MAFGLGFGVLFITPMLFWLASNAWFGRPMASLPIFIATNFFFFHAFCAISYGFELRGFSMLLLLLFCALAASVGICRSDLVWRDSLHGSRSVRYQSIMALIFSFIAILTDWWIFRRQGFDFDSGLSRFAAPFAGDHWRHTAIIAGLLRENQSIFFPNSPLVYQVLWHHGAAVIISALPALPTLFKYELGITLVTGLVMYYCIFTVILSLRHWGIRNWLLLLVIVVVAATEADIFNAGLSYLKFGGPALAADSSTSILSPYRYFSLKLVSLTAPQHAVFFLFAALVVRELYRPILNQDRLPKISWNALRASFLPAIAATIFNPILASLMFPLMYLVIFFREPVYRKNLTRLVTWCFTAGAIILILHLIILRFAIWAPFTRPNITGGGTGAYGIKFFPVLDLTSGLLQGIPLAFPAMVGITGFIFIFILFWGIFFKRELFKDPLVVTLLLSCITWNLIIGDTEIQRHYSMVLAFMALFIFALQLPDWMSHISQTMLAIPIISICFYINAVFIKAYENNASWMPLNTSWQDYYCMNALAQKGYPGIPLVVATPRHFELPIAVEAGPTLVWSQISSVHQRLTHLQAKEMDLINPRDWSTFRRIGESSGVDLVARMKALGFEGVVWGPIEEELYGPRLAALFTKPNRFLASCGLVGLYSLSDNDPLRSQNAESSYREFRKYVDDHPEHFISRQSKIGLEVFPSGNKVSIAGENIAKGAKVSLSSEEPLGVGQLVVDGLADENSSPAFLSGNQFLPWLQIDLGKIYEIESVRIVSPIKKSYPQYTLKNVYLILSDDPITERSPLIAARQAGVTIIFISGELSGDTVVPINRASRYLRIQTSDKGHLMLTEVEVYSKSKVIK